MALDQQRSRRKETGARYKRQHKKKKHTMGRSPTLTKIASDSAKVGIRVRGGSVKTRLLRTDSANVYNPKAKIIQVVENPGNRHYVRANIMTKGTIIKTDKGNARVTSRPGQDGVINAVLV